MQVLQKNHIIYHIALTNIFTHTKRISKDTCVKHVETLIHSTANFSYIGLNIPENIAKNVQSAPHL